MLTSLNPHRLVTTTASLASALPTVRFVTVRVLTAGLTALAGLCASSTSSCSGDEPPPPHSDLDASLGSDAGDAGSSSMDGGETPSEDCLVGVTNQETSEFIVVDEGGYLPMYGSGQSGLVLALAVRASGPEEPTIDIVVTSDQGEATITYLEGGRAPQCSSEVCEFLFLFIATRDLVEDPDDLAQLPVVVEVELSVDNRVYCTDSLEGRLRRADLLDAEEE